MLKWQTSYVSSIPIMDNFVEDNIHVNFENYLPSCRFEIEKDTTLRQDPYRINYGKVRRWV
jgi:hypothetical protein